MMVILFYIIHLLSQHDNNIYSIVMLGVLEDIGTSIID